MFLEVNYHNNNNKTQEMLITNCFTKIFRVCLLLVPRFFVWFSQADGWVKDTVQFFFNGCKTEAQKGLVPRAAF